MARPAQTEPAAPRRPRGRPRGTNLAPIRARVPIPMIAALDDYAARYTRDVGPMDRSDAIRIVLAEGMRVLGITLES